MLLESNNISFDSKLHNIRQLVDKKFGPNEDPIIDDVLYSADDNFTKADVTLKTDDLSENDFTESWSDVKEIFSNINSRLPIAKNTPKVQQIKHFAPVDNTIIMLPEEQETLRETLLIRPTNNTISMGEYAKGTEVAKSIENKENINHVNQKTNSFIALSPEKTNESISASCSPPIKTNNFEHNSTNDSQHRVRQVNVEMFTVTFKRRDSPNVVPDVEK